MTIHRWLGTSSTDISDTSNWDTGSAPGPGDTIIFDATAQNTCTGVLTTVLSHVVAKPEFAYGLGTSAESLFLTSSNVDLRNPGYSYLTLGSSSGSVYIYGLGTYLFTGATIESLSLLGSLNDFNNLAFTGSVTIDDTSSITDRVTISGNCAGTLNIEYKGSSAIIPTLDIDGRGTTVNLKREVTDITLEGAPTGFINTLNISSDVAGGITYPSVAIQGNTATDAVVRVTESVAITSLKMDNGTLDFSNNIANGGASVTSATLYGSAVIDTRNTLQNITLSEIKILSQDVNIKVDNGANLNLSY